MWDGSQRLGTYALWLFAQLSTVALVVFLEVPAVTVAAA